MEKVGRRFESMIKRSFVDDKKTVPVVFHVLAANMLEGRTEMVNKMHDEGVANMISTNAEYCKNNPLKFKRGKNIICFSSFLSVNRDTGVINIHMPETYVDKWNECVDRFPLGKYFNIVTFKLSFNAIMAGVIDDGAFYEEYKRINESEEIVNIGLFNVFTYGPRGEDVLYMYSVSDTPYDVVVNLVTDDFMFIEKPEGDDPKIFNGYPVEIVGKFISLEHLKGKEENDSQNKEMI